MAPKIRDQVPGLIIKPDTSREEKWQVISSIGTRMVRGRVSCAYDNLFGTFPPHRSMLRLEHFNSKVLCHDYRKMVRRILLCDDLSYFYRHPKHVESRFEQDQNDWRNGNILCPWFTTTNKPNPHHIIATSRGGNDNWKNIRSMDREHHNDFHTVFHNLTPVEQLIVMMIIHKRILNPEFIHDMKVLHKEVGEPECYRDGTIAKNYKNLHFSASHI